MTRKYAALLGAAALLVITLVAVFLATAPNSSPVRAHEDGTNHIHPTPTPTPLPPLGLAGPVSLQPELVYDEDQHMLVATTKVLNAPPPPEGWQFEHADWDVNVYSHGWHFSTRCNTSDEGRYRDGVATCRLRLPAYLNFSKLDEPLVVSMRSWVNFVGTNRPSSYITPQETIFVDLFDRNNWK